MDTSGRTHDSGAWTCDIGVGINLQLQVIPPSCDYRVWPWAFRFHTVVNSSSRRALRSGTNLGIRYAATQI